MSSNYTEAQEMAAVFIGYTARGNFDAVNLDDLQKWFEIDESQAMEVLYQIGSATLSIHFEGCTCSDTGTDLELVIGDDEDQFEIDDELWEIVQPGDPDPSVLLDDEEYNCCQSHNAPWSCTRVDGHSGQHVAGDGDEVCAVWL